MQTHEALVSMAEWLIFYHITISHYTETDRQTDLSGVLIHTSS